MSAFTAEVQGQLQAAGYLLARTVRDYYQDAEHRREFEAWYKEKYGKDYEWRKIQT